MKLLKTIVVATLALCALDLVLYSIAFSEWFIRLILQLFVCFGMPLPETSLETLALAVLKVLTYPVHSFLTGGNFGNDTVSMLFWFGVSSALWAIPLGLLVHAIPNDATVWRKKAL